MDGCFFFVAQLACITVVILYIHTSNIPPLTLGTKYLDVRSWLKHEIQAQLFVYFFFFKAFWRCISQRKLVLHAWCQIHAKTCDRHADPLKDAVIVSSFAWTRGCLSSTNVYKEHNHEQPSAEMFLSQQALSEPTLDSHIVETHPTSGN